MTTVRHSGLLIAMIQLRQRDADTASFPGIVRKQRAVTTGEDDVTLTQPHIARAVRQTRKVVEFVTVVPEEYQDVCKGGPPAVTDVVETHLGKDHFSHLQKTPRAAQHGQLVRFN